MVSYDKLPLYYRKLSQDDTYYLMTATVKLVGTLKFSAEQDPRIHKGLRELTTAIAAYETARQAKPSAPVSNLKELDKQRDRDYRDLRTYIDLQSRSRQTSKQEAAKKLQDRFSPYRNLPELSLSEQSSQLAHLLKLCEDRETKTLLTQIGASDLVANLKESQAAFEQAHLQQMTGKSQKAHPLKRQKLDDMLAIYKTIYRYLIALEAFGLDSYHRPVLAAFNDVRQTYLDKLAKQKAKTKKAEDSPLDRPL